MKITKKDLEKIIREEAKKVVEQSRSGHEPVRFRQAWYNQPDASTTNDSAPYGNETIITGIYTTAEQIFEYIQKGGNIDMYRGERDGLISKEEKGLLYQAERLLAKIKQRLRDEAEFIPTVPKDEDYEGSGE